MMTEEQADICSSHFPVWSAVYNQLAKNNNGDCDENHFQQRIQDVMMHLLL